ncbi:unnamed protein product [Lampetra planeri]
MPSAGKMSPGNLVVSCAGIYITGGSSDVPRCPAQMVPTGYAMLSTGKMVPGNRVASAAGTAAAGGSSSEPYGPR